MTELDIPASWARAIERIRREGRRRVLVIGETDIGKSSFIACLAGAMLESGSRVAVVDSDPGQKDIGPPACVTLGYPGRGGGLTDTAAAGFFFVGSTNPVGRFLPLVIGTERLTRAARASLVVVNTTGLVHGPGRVLKSYKIEALRPDLIVALEREDELRPITEAFRRRRILRLEPSPAARRKSAEWRRGVRERAFARYFAGAAERHFDLGRLAFQRTALFTGTPAPRRGARHAEATPEGLILVGGRGRGRRRARVLPAGFERDLLCGVADRRNEGAGLAILREIDFRRRRLTLLTPVAARRVSVLQFGDLYLAPDGRELGRARLPGW